MPDTDQTATLAKLRAAFKATQIGKLPRVTCRACSEAAKAGKGSCSEHSRAKCDVCGNFISSRHIHLDYVGHAAATERLLDTDPLWDWQPPSRATLDQLGEPGAIVRNGKGDPVGLWIVLTVAGKSRLGYGSVDAGATDAVKQLIGDAIRNAGMRFGIALDLWKKEEKATGSEVQDAPTRQRAQRPPASPKAQSQSSVGGEDAGEPAKGRDATPPAEQPPDEDGIVLGGSVAAQWRSLAIRAGQLGWDKDEMHRQAGVQSLKELSKDDARELLKLWAKMPTPAKEGQA